MPDTSFVRTVLGDIRPDELGPCDAHEHLFLDTPAQPGDEFLDVDKAVEEARTLVAETRLHVVAATGATLQLDGPGRTKYWPDSTRELGAELSEQIFVANPARAFACPTV